MNDVAYNDDMNALAVIALLFIITFGYVSPGYFAVGCLALALVYAATVARDKRRR